jgi:cell division septal protein FtsQ
MRARAAAISLGAFIVLAGVLCFRWAERDGRFDLETIYVTGLGCADTTAVAELLQDAFGTPLHLIDTDSLAREISGVPGIACVRLTPVWPASAHLEVELEQAAAAVETPEGLVPVSAECLELPQAWLDQGLPVVRCEEKADPGQLAAAVEFADCLGEQQDNALVLLDSTGVSVVEQDLTILLGSERLKERWDCWNAVRPLSRGASTVDLRFRNQAVIRRSS